MLPGVLPSQLPWHLGSSTPWHLDDDDDDAVAPWQTWLVSSLFSFILFSFFYLHSVVIPSISLVLSPSAFHLCTLIKRGGQREDSRRSHRTHALVLRAWTSSLRGWRLKAGGGLAWAALHRPSSLGMAGPCTAGGTLHCRLIPRFPFSLVL